MSTIAMSPVEHRKSSSGKERKSVVSRLFGSRLSDDVLDTIKSQDSQQRSKYAKPIFFDPTHSWSFLRTEVQGSFVVFLSQTWAINFCLFSLVPFLLIKVGVVDANWDTGPLRDFMGLYSVFVFFMVGFYMHVCYNRYNDCLHGYARLETATRSGMRLLVSNVLSASKLKDLCGLFIASHRLVYKELIDDTDMSKLEVLISKQAALSLLDYVSEGKTRWYFPLLCQMCILVAELTKSQSRSKKLPVELQGFVASFEEASEVLMIHAKRAPICFSYHQIVHLCVHLFFIGVNLELTLTFPSGFGCLAALLLCSSVAAALKTADNMSSPFYPSFCTFDVMDSVSNMANEFLMSKADIRRVCGNMFPLEEQQQPKARKEENTETMMAQKRKSVRRRSLLGGMPLESFMHNGGANSEAPKKEDTEEQTSPHHPNHDSEPAVTLPGEPVRSFNTPTPALRPSHPRDYTPSLDEDPASPVGDEEQEKGAGLRGPSFTRRGDEAQSGSIVPGQCPQSARGDVPLDVVSLLGNSLPSLDGGETLEVMEGSSVGRVPPITTGANGREDPLQTRYSDMEAGTREDLHRTSIPQGN